jgi:hypothetical protein
MTIDKSTDENAGAKTLGQTPPDFNERTKDRNVPTAPRQPGTEIPPEPGAPAGRNPGDLDHP